MVMNDVNTTVTSLSWNAGQRRLRHLTSCLIRNISFETTREDALPPARPALARGTSADDLDLELQRKRAKVKRRISLNQATRARKDSVSSTTSYTSAIRHAPESEPRPNTRPRTQSNASARSTASRTVNLEGSGDEEEEPLSPLPRIKRGVSTSRISTVSQYNIGGPREYEHVDTEYVIDEKGKAPACFYASDVVVSRNPSFEFDATCFLHAEVGLLRLSRFVAEVWTRESGSDQWKLHLQWDIDLTGLVPVGEELQGTTLEAKDNAIIFGLSIGGLYTAPDSSTPMMGNLTRITSLGSPNLQSGEEDEGALSDPGTSQAIAKARDARLLEESRKRDRERRQRAIEVSKRETRMLPSIGVGGTVRLLTLQTCIDDMNESIRQSVHRIARFVSDEGNLPYLKRSRDASRALIGARRTATEVSRQASSDAQKTARHRKEELSARRGILAAAKSDFVGLQEGLGPMKAIAEQTNSELLQLNRRLESDRAGKLNELDFIFPVRPSGDALLFSITGVALPNSVFDGTDDDVVSSALGLTAQLVNLIAHYLGLALPYPIVVRGSRSLVSDPITGGIRGPRAFPLYSRGVDRYRFDYAVFLLNKDVEHLLTLQSSRPIAVLDLKQTLPNLYNLILTATSERITKDNGSASLDKLAPAAPILSSSSDSTIDEESETAQDDTTDDAREPSVRSFTSGRTVRPAHGRFASDEKGGTTMRAAEKLRALNAPVVQHARAPT